MKMRPPSAEIQKRLRPFLPIVVRRAKDDGREPQDYFVLMGKYAEGEGMLVLRSEAAALLEKARTPVQRDKLERFLAKPCQEKQLLVLVTARDHVEAHFVTVPTLAREPGAKRFVSAREMQGVERYLEVHGAAMYARIAFELGRPADFVAIARLPNEAPVVMPREMAREAMITAGFGEVLKELDVPATADDELLVVYKIGSVPSWSRLHRSPAPSNDRGVARPTEVSREELARYVTAHVAAMYTTILEEKGRPGDYVAMLRPPNHPPLLLDRAEARKRLAFAHLGADIQQMMEEVNRPAGEDELRIVYRAEGKWQSSCLTAEIRQRPRDEEPPE
jgi:hypothetical protein